MRHKPGRADRGVRPYELTPTKNASHTRRHERRKNSRFHSRLSLNGAFSARPGGGHLHPPRSRTHFPRRFTGRLAAGDRPSLGKAVARTLSDQRAIRLGLMVAGFCRGVKPCILSDDFSRNNSKHIGNLSFIDKHDAVLYTFQKTAQRRFLWTISLVPVKALLSPVSS